MNDQTIVKQDMYDSVVDGIAQFTGICVGVFIRYATVNMPAGTTMVKKVLHESGSLAMSTAAMGMTRICVKTIGEYLKPRIVKK